eukprot:5764509-Alexandrium_andersonii.AAC.1
MPLATPNGGSSDWHRGMSTALQSSFTHWVSKFCADSLRRNLHPGFPSRARAARCWSTPSHLRASPSGKSRSGR